VLYGIHGTFVPENFLGHHIIHTRLIRIWYSTSSNN